MIANYHTHTVFSDGKNTPEEVAEAAFKMGMDCLGFSDHSALSPDHLASHDWTMHLDRYPEYQREIGRLKEQYAGKMKILCGLEQDLLSPPPPDGFDYLIGSVHVLHPDGQVFGVDESPAAFRFAIDNFYGGDVYALCEDYYRSEAALADIPFDIIGHFDLVTKFNENGVFFDETHPRYVAARNRALDILLKTGRTFEVNTGAISRGYRTTPYPSAPTAAYILEHGGKLILASDSHAADTLLFGFDRWKTLLGP